MPLRLSFESGPLAGIHIVTSSQTIRLGRDPGQNDILLTNPKVSRRHAVIERSITACLRETFGLVRRMSFWPGSRPSRIVCEDVTM